MRKEKKDAELQKLLYALSEKVLTEDELQNITIQLQTIYKGEYRHSYSSLFSTVEEINDNAECSKQYLLENLLGL